MDEVLTFLKYRLSQPLPGHEATQEMSARLANGQKVKMQHDEPPKEGAVMVLFYPDDKIIRFPLIQRPEYPGVHSGQMALPGGKKERGETDIETALRETEEEIGVSANRVEVVGTLSSFYVSASNFSIQPVIGAIHEKPRFVPEENEVAEIVSARVKHLLYEDYLKEKEITVGGGFRLQAPYFDLEGKVVWGATAMMLNELRWILREKNLDL